MKSVSILTLSPGFGACAINPVTGELEFAIVSEAEEIEHGHRYDKEIIAGHAVDDDPALAIDLQQRKGWEGNNTSPQFLQARLSVY